MQENVDSAIFWLRVWFWSADCLATPSICETSGGNIRWKVWVETFALLVLIRTRSSSNQAQQGFGSFVQFEVDSEFFIVSSWIFFLIIIIAGLIRFNGFFNLL